jgi:hypothetical protein
MVLLLNWLARIVYYIKSSSLLFSSSRSNAEITRIGLTVSIY